MKASKRLLLLLAALLLPLALVSGGGAQAAPSAKTAFHVTGAGMGTSSRPIDTTHVSAEVVFTGDISASGTEVFNVTTDASGNVHFHGYGIFAGTVGDRRGTFSYHFSGTTAGGRITFDSGMEQLEGMQGHIRWTTTATGFSYDGGVRFPS